MPTKKSGGPHEKGEWPFPAAAQPEDKSDKLDESALTPGERVTDTSTRPDGGKPNATLGTYELTGDRGHDQLARDAADQRAQAPKDIEPG